MRVLLVGSTGFIGGHLKSRLDKEGHEVIPFPRDWGFDWGKRPDVIINCAGELDKESEMVGANLQLPTHLLDQMRHYGTRRFIQIGSSSETGPVEGPRHEDMACHPSNVYEMTKLAATSTCISYANAYDLDVCVARPFTIYGPGDKPRKLLPTLWAALLDGGAFTCYPGGHDWTHVSDFVEGIVLLLNAPREKTKGEIYHFGTGVSTSNEEIVRLFERVAGSLYRVDYVKKKLRPYDVMDWRADNTKARKQLGWEPKVTVEQGIRDYVMTEWFKQERTFGL